MTTRDKPRRSPKRSDLRSRLVITTHMVFVFLPVYLAAAVGPSLWILPLWLWFGVTMHGILNLMHEASHFHLFRDRKASDRIGHWLLGPLVGSDFEVYRQRHWDHHRFIGEVNDTKDAYRLDLHGRRGVRFLGQCLTLQEAFTKFRNTRMTGDEINEDQTAPEKSHAWMFRALVVHFFFAVSLLATAAAVRGSFDMMALLAACLAWGFVYLYGMLSLTLFVASLRTLAEHGVGNDEAIPSGRAQLRNLRCGPLGRLLFGCWGFAEHATHHRYPSVPAYRLGEETRRRIADGEEDLRPGVSYPQRLRECLQSS